MKHATRNVRDAKERAFAFGIYLWNAASLPPRYQARRINQHADVGGKMNKDVRQRLALVVPRVADVGGEGKAAADDNEHKVLRGEGPIADGHEVSGRAAHDLRTR